MDFMDLMDLMDLMDFADPLALRRRFDGVCSRTGISLRRLRLRPVEVFSAFGAVEAVEAGRPYQRQT